MEAVFIPVKLDEGFDFSLFLEDLGFELPMDMMLLRMRQQHPVVVRALRSRARADEPQPWEGVRTAGTLVAFRAARADAVDGRGAWPAARPRPPRPRPSCSRASRRSRRPAVQGTDVYDLEDARAVIDRLKWATERIEELEERSRIVEDAAAQSRRRARARRGRRARRARRQGRDRPACSPSGPVDADRRGRPRSSCSRASSASSAPPTDAAETAAAQRVAAETERARTAELEAQRAELMARLDALEHGAGAARAAEVAIAEARAELLARLETPSSAADDDRPARSCRPPRSARARPAEEAEELARPARRR